MNNVNALTVDVLLDREAIRECMYRYCRGIDRLDEDALRSAYWPDATDQHGGWSGSATGFIDYALGRLRAAVRQVHLLGNISIELRGVTAAVESYFQALQVEPNAEGRMVETLICGRYVDRFERRDGEWRVAVRTVVFDFIKETAGPDSGEAERFGSRTPIGGRKPDDPWYAMLGTAPFAA